MTSHVRLDAQQSYCQQKGLQPRRLRTFGQLYLHDGTGCQDLLFDVGVTGRATDRGEVAHGILGRHRLAGSRLPADYDGLVLLVSEKEKALVSCWPRKGTLTFQGPC